MDEEIRRGDRVRWQSPYGGGGAALYGTVVEGPPYGLISVLLDCGRIAWDKPEFFTKVKPPLPPEPTEVGYVYTRADGQMFVRHNRQSVSSGRRWLSLTDVIGATQIFYSWAEIHALQTVV